MNVPESTKEFKYMKYIDLHVHSNVSDGTMTPTQLVEEAARNHVAAFALTDHDTTAGIQEAWQAAKASTLAGHPVEVIAGVEISAEYKDTDIHILGLMINPEHTALEEALKKALHSRENRNQKMAENLANAGLDISMEQLLDYFGTNAVLTRAHFATYLYETKQISSVNEAFRVYLNPQGPYYVPRKYIKPKDAIALIKKAGGIAVLAHPFVYHLPDEELDALIANLKRDGLEGLEVFYSSNTGFDEGIARRYANKYDLIMTGGSDFHGENKPLISMGTGRGNLKIPYSVLEKLKQRCS